ncbi:MAG: FAD synthetase [Rikenellaceae bacterium]
MRVFSGFEGLPDFGGAVATLGSFDGLHRGHLSLLDSVKELSAKSGGESVVMTFDPHPRVVLGRAEGLRLLTTTEEKINLLEGYGIDNLIVIPFDRELSRFSYRDFVKSYLVDRVKISTLVVGYNHHMGRGSEGGYNDLVKMGCEFGFRVHRVEEWCDEGHENISSTVVRRLLASGCVEQANHLLSRPYQIVGQVDSDGRVWVADALKLLPSAGRYRVIINNHSAILDIGEDGVARCDEFGPVLIEVCEKI